jgi:hypothetical protein
MWENPLNHLQQNNVNNNSNHRICLSYWIWLPLLQIKINKMKHLFFLAFAVLILFGCSKPKLKPIPSIVGEWSNPANTASMTKDLCLIATNQSFNYKIGDTILDLRKHQAPFPHPALVDSTEWCYIYYNRQAYPRWGRSNYTDYKKDKIQDTLSFSFSTFNPMPTVFFYRKK